MQPSWLEPHRQKWYRLATGIIIYLIIGLFSGLIDGLIGGVLDIRITGGVMDIRITGVLLGIILGLTNGLLAGGLIFVAHTVVRPPLIDEITPYEVFDLKLSLIGLSQSIYSVIFLTILILIFGSAIGLAMGLMISLVYGLTSGLILGLMAGIMLSLITVLHGSLKSRDKPNQGIWNSGKNGFIITVFSFPFALATSLIISLDSNNPFSYLGILYVFIMTPIFSLVLGIYLGGGLAFIQHFVLRYFLIRAGHVPRDYVGFLKYAEERGLILRNGGSFRFYHDLLREHLAGNTPITSPALPKKSSNDWLQWSGISILFVLLFAVISIGGITSPTGADSITPVMKRHDTVLLDRITIRFRSFNRGNMVYFETNENLAKQGFDKSLGYFRRIVGLPQETVEIKEGKVYINSQLLTTPYAQAPPACTYPPTLIPADHYFLMGNNPAFPDCNTYSALVPKANITGQALWRLLPLSRFGQIE